jgi:hypothetical protein
MSHFHTQKFWFKISPDKPVHNSSVKKRTEPVRTVFSEQFKSLNVLKKRYGDFAYVLRLVLDETGFGRRGKDCTCKNNMCKKLFEMDNAAVQRIQQGLLANWGPHSSKKDRKSNVLQDLLVGRQYDDKLHKLVQRYLIDGHQVCYNFYLVAWGDSHNFVHSHRTLLQKKNATFTGLLQASHQRNEFKSPKKDVFITWLHSFGETVGDYMPDENAVVLPYPKFEGVFLEYEMEMQRRQESSICYSYACRIFFDEIENIRLVRSKGSHVCCKICTSYQMRILKAGTQYEREELKKLRLQHVQKQRQERLFYYANRERAISSPDRFLSIIIDGMDQSKTNVPLLSKKTSDKTVGHRLIGVKVHGVGNYVYILDDTVPGGANLMVEVLRGTLLKLEEQGKLPPNNPILNLQMDNCSENKNKVLFGFLSDLVSRKVFSEVYVGFLMVGHTHEDIDQLFSVIAAWLRKHETICPDPPSLRDAIIAAFANSPKLKFQIPHVFFLHALELFDYDKFYDGFMNKTLCYYSKPHQFRFKTFDGVTLCHYKMWAVDAQYLPIDNSSNQPLQIGGCDLELKSESTKKRAFVRGVGKPKAKRRQKLLQSKTGENFSSDCGTCSDSDSSSLPSTSDSENERKTNQHPIFKDRYVAQSHPQTVHCQGVLWLTSRPPATAVPEHISICAEKMSKYSEKATAMHTYIREKSATLNPSIFTELVLANWDIWHNTQQVIWTQPDMFLQKLSPFVWPLPFQSRAKNVVFPVVNPSEPTEEPAGTEIVVHESGHHGHFTKADRTDLQRQRHIDSTLSGTEEIIVGKACIFRWQDCTDKPKQVDLDSIEQLSEGSDEELQQFLWVGIVHSIEGSPMSPNCKLTVRWCPNEKKRNPTFRSKISADDTFDIKYCKMTGPTSRYVSIITRRNCLAFNLDFTASGKFDNRARVDGHLGSTSKEVAKNVLEEFYSTHEFS